eukprot:m.305984 g.305984  ORF g.305984 m.305984 type:complete len:333 (-) comp19615_c0_seq11:128-1126(-)
MVHSRNLLLGTLPRGAKLVGTQFGAATALGFFTHAPLKTHAVGEKHWVILVQFVGTQVSTAPFVRQASLVGHKLAGIKVRCRQKVVLGTGAKEQGCGRITIVEPNAAFEVSVANTRASRPVKLHAKIQAIVASGHRRQVDKLVPVKDGADTVHAETSLRRQGDITNPDGIVGNATNNKPIDTTVRERREHQETLQASSTGASVTDLWRKLVLGWSYEHFCERECGRCCTRRQSWPCDQSGRRPREDLGCRPLAWRAQSCPPRQAQSTAARCLQLFRRQYKCARCHPASQMVALLSDRWKVHESASRRKQPQMQRYSCIQTLSTPWRLVEDHS